MIFLNIALKWILRCLQDINKKIHSNLSSFLINQKTKNKQNLVKKIFVDYKYFGGYVTNVLFNQDLFVLWK